MSVKVGVRFDGIMLLTLLAVGGVLVVWNQREKIAKAVGGAVDPTSENSVGANTVRVGTGALYESVNNTPYWLSEGAFRQWWDSDGKDPETNTTADDYWDNRDVGFYDNDVPYIIE